MRRMDRSSFITFELGFQAGFQNVTVRNVDTELSSRLYHVGLGFGRYLPSWRGRQPVAVVVG